MSLDDSRNEILARGRIKLENGRAVAIEPTAGAIRDAWEFNQFLDRDLFHANVGTDLVESALLQAERFARSVLDLPAGADLDPDGLLPADLLMKARVLEPRARYALDFYRNLDKFGWLGLIGCVLVGFIIGAVAV